MNYHEDIAYEQGIVAAWNECRKERRLYQDSFRQGKGKKDNSCISAITICMKRIEKILLAEQKSRHLRYG